MTFESDVGDLASILKVEKRRAQIIGKVCLYCICDQLISSSIMHKF